MILNNAQIVKVYGRIAPRYDTALLCYRLLGINRQRRELVRRLDLHKGDTVVDLGCGTGANFDALFDAVGPGGEIIGVDLSEAMLDKARMRAQQRGQDNVTLVCSDLREFRLPRGTAAVIAAFSMEMVPDNEEVIGRLAASLGGEGRLGLLGLKLPERWPEWAIRLGLALNRPFGVSRDYAAVKPWIGVQKRMRVKEFRELYFGAVYRCIAVPSPRA